ncbi:hypothetical protein BJX76DRAFT_358347 [Aspergillus varians]
MANDGRFGAILGSGPGKWRLIVLREIPWLDLLQVLGVTTTDEVLVPTREYDCPAHIIGIIQDHNVVRESQIALEFGLLLEGSRCVNGKTWKLKTVIKSCLAAERLDLEGRAAGSPLLSASELLRLPCPIFHRSGTHSYVGFRYKGENRYLRTGTIQAARKERTGEEENMDVYGIVTSGDIVQFHKLKAYGEVQSSAMFLLTAEGLPFIWSLCETLSIKFGYTPQGTELKGRARVPHKEEEEVDEAAKAARNEWRRIKYLHEPGKPESGMEVELEQTGYSSDEEPRCYVDEPSGNRWYQNQTILEEVRARNEAGRGLSEWEVL